MLSGTTTIYFSTELRFPPIPDFRISDQKIITLYGKLREPGQASRYENLDLQAETPTLSTRRQGGLSACMLNSDLVRIEEDCPPDLNIDGFIEHVETVLKAIDDVPPFILQRCTIRCLAQPTNSEDSLELLAGRVAD